MKKEKKKLIIMILIMVATLLISATMVKAETGAFHNFTGLYVKTTEAEKGEKVYVDLYCMDDVTSVRVFLMGNSQYLTADVYDIKTNNPYFIMPNDVVEGVQYEIKMIEVNCNDGSVSYATSQGGMNYTNCFGKKYVKAVASAQKNTLELTNLALGSHYDTITKGKNERLWLDLELKGTGDVSLVTIIVRNKNEYNSSALLNLEEENGLQYIDFSKVWNTSNLVDGDYYISSVYINPNREDYIVYSKGEVDGDIYQLNFDINFKIANEETSDNASNTEKNATTALKSISLASEKAKQNDKVYVNLKVEDFEAVQAMLSFTDTTNAKNFVVYLKDVKSKPYFVIPFTTEAGNYELNYVVLKDKEGNKKEYRKGDTMSTIEHFDFDSVITVEENNLEDIDILNIDNDKITMEIIKKISDVESNIKIEVDASNNPIISQALFEAIKGQDKILVIKYNDVEWIFNGNDIKGAKSIDVSVQITDNVDELTGISNGIKIVFAENGTLPGKCLIRIANSNIMNSVLDSKNANVYYYNKEQKLYDEIGNNITMTNDGYYEFYIDHNSSYVMTTEKLPDTYIANKISDTANIESNSSATVQNNKLSLNTILIIITLVVATMALIFAVVSLKKKK